MILSQPAAGENKMYIYSKVTTICYVNLAQKERKQAFHGYKIYCQEALLQQITQVSLLFVPILHVCSAQISRIKSIYEISCNVYF